jgi:hypothetical protein
MAKAQTAVVVTTEYRGVFFGYVNGAPTDAKTIRIERARMCVYWSANMKGVLGLAAKGPTEECRIGPAVPAITLLDVTSVMEVSEDAVKAWEKNPWK